MTNFLLALLTTAAALALRARAKRRPSGEGKRLPLARAITFTVMVLSALFWLLSVVRVVPPGNIAIPVTLGNVGSSVGPGIHIVSPFTSLKNVSVRTEQYTMASGGSADGSADAPVGVLGKDGAAGSVNATLLFRIERDTVTTLYREIGSNYEVKVIRPSARACVRSAFTHFDMVEAATTAWSRVDDNITTCLSDKLERRGIVVEDFQLRELDLSKQVQNAIDGKVAAQQVAERQQFELAKAEQQANIKRVEAHATADAQQILACGGEDQTVERDGKTVHVVVPNASDKCSQTQLTPAYLQFTYIQTLKELVNSPNNTAIILPFDQNLTPLLNLPSSLTSPTTAP